jgi:hypothetical protein
MVLQGHFHAAVLQQTLPELAVSDERAKGPEHRPRRCHRFPSAPRFNMDFDKRRGTTTTHAYHKWLFELVKLPAVADLLRGSCHAVV